jgi:hypothetical protein
MGIAVLLIIIIIHHSSPSFPVLGILRPVTGVIKLNPSIFSKVFLNFISFLIAILGSFWDPVRAHRVNMLFPKIPPPFFTEHNDPLPFSQVIVTGPYFGPNAIRNFHHEF